MSKIIKTEAEWRAQLTPEQYRVAREKGTERAFTGQYWDNHAPGTYVCVCCGQELFSSDTKFDSGTGWPSFWQPMDKDKVATEEDRSLFMRRTEVIVFALRRASRPCFPRWAEADRIALLHQFGCAGAQAQEVGFSSRFSAAPPVP